MTARVTEILIRGCWSAKFPPHVALTIAALLTGALYLLLMARVGIKQRIHNAGPLRWPDFPGRAQCALKLAAKQGVMLVGGRRFGATVIDSLCEILA
jgi:hypothetical protein